MQYLLIEVGLVEAVVCTRVLFAPEPRKEGAGGYAPLRLLRPGGVRAARRVEVSELTSPRAAHRQKTYYCPFPPVSSLIRRGESA